MRHARLLALLLPLTALLASDYAEEGKLWWAHIQFLADDKLEGRDTGSAGYLQAAEYVTKQFKRFGLKPAGSQGFLQTVPFETRTVDPGRCSVTLVRDGLREPLQLGLDVNLSPSADMPPSLTAPLVFAGYGLSIPGTTPRLVDVRGKIVVYVAANGPAIAPQNIQSYYASAGQRWSELRKQGAVGLALIPNPRLEPPAPAVAAPVPSAPPAPSTSVLLAEPALQETEGMSVAMSVSRRAGEKLFAGSGHSFAEIAGLAAANQPLPEFPLASTLEIKSEMSRARMESPNLVAMLPGSDRNLKSEYVVFSAHLDHIGKGAPVNGDSVYNGAMDNASGVASVLEVARLMHETHAKPKRSVLFLVVTGEEKGLLGSKYFAAHPTIPADMIVADINVDALLPLYELKTLEIQGLEESTLGDKIRAAAGALGVDVQTDREPEENRFIRSDHFSFVQQGIPALAFKFGYEYGSPEETARHTWWDRHYHQPSDDTSQPMNQVAAAKFDRVILGLLNSIADDPARPAWLPQSFFRQFRK